MRDSEQKFIPLMLILSPKWASVRISAQSEIVRVLPPSLSSWVRVVTAELGQKL